MKKRVLASLILASVISLGGYVCESLDGIHQEIQSRENMIEEKQSIINDLEEELNLTEDELNETKETISNLEENIKTKEQELHNKSEENKKLQEEIDAMYRQVSLNSQDVSQPSGSTLYHIKKALKGTTMEHLAEGFYLAEQETGVNAYFLMGIVALESSWGKSTRALNGSYNLTGHAVYEDSSKGSQFSSYEDCILTTAKDIKRDYLTEDGIWHNGYSIASVNVKYSADSGWKDKVAEIGYDLLWKANN